MTKADSSVSKRSYLLAAIQRPSHQAYNCEKVNSTRAHPPGNLKAFVHFLSQRLGIWVLSGKIHIHMVSKP